MSTEVIDTWLDLILPPWYRLPAGSRGAVTHHPSWRSFGGPTCWQPTREQDRFNGFLSPQITPSLFEFIASKTTIFPNLFGKLSPLNGRACHGAWACPKMCVCCTFEADIGCDFSLTRPWLLQYRLVPLPNWQPCHQDQLQQTWHKGGSFWPLSCKTKFSQRS